jgi:hypothetical protein
MAFNKQEFGVVIEIGRFCGPKDLLGSLVDLGYIVSGDSQAIIDLTVPYRKEHMGFTIHVNSRSSWCPFHWLLCP